MSRIFEALTKASEERIEPESRKWVIGGGGFAKEIVNPHWPSPTPSAEITIPQRRTGTKLWHEHLEELLLGWDLRRYKTHPIVVLEKESPAMEQYKILREQVKRLCSETRARTLSVTSPVKRDGKTMVAVNLASAIALDYKEQVLLIDGDLRSPQVHRYFGMQPRPGLADYLSSSSKEDLSGYIQGTFLTNLKVLPAGNPQDLSSELLGKLKTRNLMEEICAMFSGYLIVIDTPPVLSTPDPLIIARTVEGILMVIRAGKTPRNYLLEAVECLNSSKLMGIVLNGTNLGFSYKYYYNSEKQS